ncbi:MAG: hypothetical protein C5B52_10495 [Bacteroidetes bacterium]|nr:MAG: hypothetical protein C5B52_10495 [Bacteroidota bacterium]
MRKTICCFCLFILSFITKAQFKNDNVLFKTVYLQDLCKELTDHPGYIILDVRSDGEFNDTLSSSPGLNIGRLKDAKHISIQELSSRWKELMPYKDKPLFIYCSHSQRSRRASKMLADSGFTKLFNVNGGLSSVYLSDLATANCLQNLVETNLPYRIISPREICRKLADNGKKPFILDIRSDSAFKGISRVEKENAYATIKESISIPLENLESRIAEVPKDKEIIIVDIYGDESPKAAKLLLSKGYSNISILFDGIDSWYGRDDEELSCKKSVLVNRRIYQTITAEDFVKQSLHNENLLILDVRNEDEFANKSKFNWRNIGNIKNAKNIPLEKLKDRAGEISAWKDKPVVVYAFSNNPESYDAAATLIQMGFANVYVLDGGIWSLRWTSANIKGKNYMEDWIVNVPPENK